MLDFRCIVDAKIIRTDYGYRCENFECQDIVKRCECSEDVELKIVVFELSIQIGTVLYISLLNKCIQLTDHNLHVSAACMPMQRN